MIFDGSQTAMPQVQDQKVELDSEAGYDSCVEEIMIAFEQHDKSKLKRGLKNMISMVLDHRDFINEHAKMENVEELENGSNGIYSYRP